MAWWLLLAVALGQSSETPEGPVEEPPPLVSLPELLHFVQAPYPPEALEAEQQGIVGLLLEIDAEGAVVSAEVLRSDPLFDAAAVEASLEFLFSPAEDETGPIGVIIEFDYGFVLDSAEVEDAQPEEPVVLPIQIEGTVLEMATRRPLEGMSVVLLELERAQLAAQREKASEAERATEEARERLTTRLAAFEARRGEAERAMERAEALVAERLDTNTQQVLIRDFIDDLEKRTSLDGISASGGTT